MESTWNSALQELVSSLLNNAVGTLEPQCRVSLIYSIRHSTAVLPRVGKTHCQWKQLDCGIKHIPLLSGERITGCHIPSHNLSPSSSPYSNLASWQLSLFLYIHLNLLPQTCGNCSFVFALETLHVFCQSLVLTVPIYQNGNS